MFLAVNVDYRLPAEAGSGLNNAPPYVGRWREDL